MLPWKLRKRHILPASQNLLSVYFSLAKFQLVSCNLSLAMIWQRTYTHKLPKLCSVTLNVTLNLSNIEAMYEESRVNVKVEPRSTFRFTRETSYCLYFISAV